MNDYERRFQRSLQKLTVPAWYTDINLLTNITNGSKQSIISTASTPWRTHCRETQRTPEIIHLQHPYNYRSCRSSLATSPSPSVHSWHPNHIMDDVNFSLLKPSSTRRHNKYENGIVRVSKSSRWYQPTQFITNKTANGPPGTMKISTPIRHNQQSTKNNHYDAPKIYYNNESLIFKSNSLVTNGNVENIIVNEQNNNVISNDKQQDNHINSNESRIMPMADIQKPFNHIKLEDRIGKKNDNLMENNKLISSITNLSLANKQIDNNEVLKRTASDLVDSVLADILLLNNLDDYDDDDDDDDKNSGVRELSDDENGLRELDEDDMNDTDEFIVFPAQAEISHDDQILNTPRCSLNRLYTFSKTNNYSIDNARQTASNQNLRRSILEEQQEEEDDHDDDQTIHFQSNSNTEQSPSTYPYQIEKQDNHLHKYIDRIICPSNRQLSIHQSEHGVNEETARIGRLLLNSIPAPYSENIHDLILSPTSDQQILENTYDVVLNHDKNHESLHEDYYQHPPRIIEEYPDDLDDKIHFDSAYSSNQERIDFPQSCYEPLYDCYSGYSFIQSDFLTPNISSIQSTTDEAYESEPTTVSSSIVTTAHIHPDLQHEFEYPAPPPPVPDRRLKPVYLKSLTQSQSTQQTNIDSAGYSIVQKSKPPSLAAIHQLITSTSHHSTSLSAKTKSSRYYCGSIPVSKEVASSLESTPIKTHEQSKDKKKDKRTSKTLSCLHPSTSDDYHNNKRDSMTKSSSSSSSSNKTKIKKQKLITDFDEATNGLAIRLPAPVSNGHDLTNKQNFNRSSAPLSIKRANGMTKNRQISDNIKSDRLPFYETSV